MNSPGLNHPALLPAGLRDVLPPHAELSARSVETIMGCFAAHGYQRVAPPLLEFEDSLFAGSGAATADQTFRLMDPDSQRMMGLRADTTPQIARLATTRLAAAPRPLRLAYAGQCLRVRGTHLAPERQVAQAGIELIGNDSAESDAEIILTAVAALAAIGLTGVSVDLTVPQLVSQILEGGGISDPAALARALDRKDNAEVAAQGGRHAGLLCDLLAACGTAERAIPALLEIDLPDAAGAQARRLARAVAAVRARDAALAITIDPVESRGFRYHTGICITLFAPGRQAELGRGGRYLSGETEPAIGLTLYPDTIIEAAPLQALRPRVLLPFGTPAAQAAQCRERGFATVAALEPVADPAAEAARLACSHVFEDGVLRTLTGAVP